MWCAFIQKCINALGVAVPPGVPFAFTEPVADPLGDLLVRYALGTF